MSPSDSKQYYLSPELAHRLAAIDIGTNSIRLVVAEALRGGAYRVLDDEKETTRLGRNLATTGRLDPEAVEQSLAALRRMKTIAAGYQVRETRVIATCAVRDAEDGEQFRARARDELGLEIEIISGETEAHLAFISVARNFDLAGKNVAVADIGGGSTEVVLASGTVTEALYTMPLGAVRLSERFTAAHALSDDQFAALLRAIDVELRTTIGKPMLMPHLLIGSGGTFTSLAEMVMAAKGQSGLPLRGFEITRAEVRHLLERLRKASPKTRRATPGLSPDRADIIVGGVAIIDRVMRHLELNRLQVHDQGVRDGLMLTMLDASIGHTGLNPHDQESALERFAARCGVDLRHGRQVARLAGLIFSQLLDEFRLDPADRPLLEAAARLQDVGYLINYEQHHKHSFHLILNSRLSGFRPQDLRIIAHIARYHRGAPPKRKHRQFQLLAAPDQQRVRRLASILRIAGGLDRSHSQQIQAVSVSRISADELVFQVLAPHMPEVDLWGARKRVSLFETAFAVKARIEWADARPANAKPGEAASTASPPEPNAAGHSTDKTHPTAHASPPKSKPSRGKSLRPS